MNGGTMALIKCPECKQDISDSAKACPNCGHSKKERKTLGCGALILVLIVGVYILGTFSPTTTTTTATTPVPEKPKTPEQIRKDKIEYAFNLSDGSQRKLVSHVKQSLKDPKSFEHIETKYYDKKDYLMVIMRYRAKNSFGGYVVNTATAKTTIDGNIISVDLSE